MMTLIGNSNVLLKGSYPKEHSPQKLVECRAPEMGSGIERSLSRTQGEQFSGSVETMLLRRLSAIELYQRGVKERTLEGDTLLTRGEKRHLSKKERGHNH